MGEGGGENILFLLEAEIGAEVVDVGVEGVDYEGEGTDVGQEVLGLPFVEVAGLGMVRGVWLVFWVSEGQERGGGCTDL